MQNSDFPNIPRSWQVKTLDSFGTFIRGVSYKKEQLLKEKTSNSVFLLRANNIQEKLDLADLQIVPKELAEDKIIKDNDILFAMSSGSKHIVGKNIILQNLQDYSFGAFCGLFRNTSKVLDSRYLAYFLQSDFYKKYIIKFAKGTNINNLRFGDLEKLPIPIPPLEIQKCIAKRLDKAFSRIENGTKHLQSAKDNLTKYKQSLLKSAFNGTLTQDCHESPRDSLNDKSANLPQGWIIKTLGEVCEKVERRSKGYNKKEFSYIDISSIDNHKNIITKTEKYNLDKAPSRAQQILKTNDILFSTVRTYLKNIAFVSNEYDDCIASTGFCVIRVNDKMLFPKFMFYKSLSDNFIAELNKLQRGSSYPAVSDKDVFAQQIKIPPLETQKQIVAILEKHFTSADKVSAYIDSCLTKAKQLKSSLLKSAFSGKL